MKEGKNQRVGRAVTFTLSKNMDENNSRGRLVMVFSVSSKHQTTKRTEHPARIHAWVQVCMYCARMDSAPAVSQKLENAALQTRSRYRCTAISYLIQNREVCGHRVRNSVRFDRTGMDPSALRGLRRVQIHEHFLWGHRVLINLG